MSNKTVWTFAAYTLAFLAVVIVVVHAMTVGDPS
jgi:hypothetical protein